MIEAAWGSLCSDAGLQSQWEATLRASVYSVQRAAAGLSALARSLLSLGMGANGYIPPTSDAERRRRGNDYVAPGTQEHLLGAVDPTDFMYNAFGHASALMQELERAYSPAAVENASPTSCACSPLHRDPSCGDPHCRWIRPRPTFTAEREAQDVEYAAAVRNDEDRDEEERQREEAERALAGPVQVDVVRAARLQRLAGGGEIS